MIRVRPGISESVGYQREFAAVDLLLNSEVETRGVDVFALCVIKMERQLRRLFTHSVFQFSNFTDASVPQLKAALVDQRIYFGGFIKGFDAIHPKSIANLIGSEYTRLYSIPSTVTKHRNKIFHGQITGQELGRRDLLDCAADLQEWCKRLGEGAREYMGYEGFDDSFRKAYNREFVSEYQLSLASVDEYRELLKTLL